MLAGHGSERSFWLFRAVRPREGERICPNILTRNRCGVTFLPNIGKFLIYWNTGPAQGPFCDGCRSGGLLSQEEAWSVPARSHWLHQDLHRLHGMIRWEPGMTRWRGSPPSTAGRPGRTRPRGPRPAGRAMRGLDRDEIMPP